MIRTLKDQKRDIKSRGGGGSRSRRVPAPPQCLEKKIFKKKTGNCITIPCRSAEILNNISRLNYYGRVVTEDYIYIIMKGLAYIHSVTGNCQKMFF